MRLILASASPRRRELLAGTGVRFDVVPVDVDERQVDGEAPAVYVERLARLKADAAAARHPETLVIGADTAVVIAGEVLGKPVGALDAARMLRRLGGRTHEVLTGVAIAGRGPTFAFVERTFVTMSPLTEDAIARYVATGEPLDKAGAYAIQGGAAAFVSGIQGSYTNVVGLPVERLLQEIQAIIG